MAKKSATPTAKKTSPVTTAGSEGIAMADGNIAAPVAESVQPVRKTIPAKPAKSADQATPKREITHQMIAERAYELYTQGTPGGPEDHWLLAEQELRGKA